MSYVDEVIEQVVAQNPAEPEFHQAVKEVLESLRAVVEANEEAFRRDALLERLVNPERQFKFRVPWVDDKGQVHVNTGYRVPVSYTHLAIFLANADISSLEIGEYTPKIRSFSI